jgi:flavodoxin
MKALVVFYTRTGTTKKLAQAIAKELKGDIDEVIDKVDRSGAVGYFKAGRDAIKRKLTEIEKTKKDSSKYEVVLIGTPVWGWNMAPAIRTYIEQNKKKFKNVAFFCTQASSGAEGTFKEMESISKKPVSVLQLKTNQVMRNDFEDEMKNFLSDLKKSD